MAGHVFAAGEKLTAATLNTYMVQPGPSQANLRVAWGTDTITVTSGAGNKTVTVSGLTTVLAAVCADGNITSNSALPLAVRNPSGNTFIATAGGNANYTGSVLFFYIAFGT
jgi:hypothetical protein